MKEATSLLIKVRSAARRRLFLDEARRWSFVVCLLILFAQIDFEFLDKSSVIIKIVCLFVLLGCALVRLKRLRRRVPTLYQTARRLEEKDADLQGVLTAALEFESSSVAVTSDSQSLRNATTNRARRRLEEAFEDGRVRELRDVALRRTQSKRRTWFVVLEGIGTFCAAFLIVARFVWFAPSEKISETTTIRSTTNETERTTAKETNAIVEDVATFEPTSDSLDDELAFLRETLVRSVSLVDSLARELCDASSDSFDSKLAFQLARELDSTFRSSSGLVATVAKIRATFVLLQKQDVGVFLLIRRLREFDEYLSKNQNVGSELTRSLATSTRSFSRDVRREAFEKALETLRRTRERLHNEERALNYLAFSGEVARKFSELEQERAALLQSAIKRLQARPGALSGVEASNLTTDDFLIRLDAFGKEWKERRDELNETARRLREPDANDFVLFVTRFAAQTDSYELLLGSDKTQVDLTRRFERPLASISQIKRNARVERWGKAATELNETPSARDMLGADICEGQDFASTLAWRLAFGVFDGSRVDFEDVPLNDEESEERKNAVVLDETSSREKIQATLERMKRDAELASQPISFSKETRSQERPNESFDVSLKSDQTSEEGTAPDERFEGGASAKETNASLANKTDAFSGELPNLAQERLESGKRWNPPREYREKERAFQERLREETRKTQIPKRSRQTSPLASK